MIKEKICILPSNPPMVKLLAWQWKESMGLTMGLLNAVAVQEAAAGVDS